MLGLGSDGPGLKGVAKGPGLVGPAAFMVISDGSNNKVPFLPLFANVETLSILDSKDPFEDISTKPPSPFIDPPFADMLP